MEEVLKRVVQGELSIEEALKILKSDRIKELKGMPELVVQSAAKTPPRKAGKKKRATRTPPARKRPARKRP